MTRTYLEGLGYRVLEEDVLKLLRSQRSIVIDLILMMCMMLGCAAMQWSKRFARTTSTATSSSSSSLHHHHHHHHHCYYYHQNHVHFIPLPHGPFGRIGGWNDTYHGSMAPWLHGSMAGSFEGLESDGASCSRITAYLGRLLRLHPILRFHYAPSLADHLPAHSLSRRLSPSAPTASSSSPLASSSSPPILLRSFHPPLYLPTPSSYASNHSSPTTPLTPPRRAPYSPRHSLLRSPPSLDPDPIRSHSFFSSSIFSIFKSSIRSLSSPPLDSSSRASIRSLFLSLSLSPSIHLFFILHRFVSSSNHRHFLHPPSSSPIVSH